MGVIARVLSGFIFASLAAGLTTALFVHTPEQLASSSPPDVWSQLGDSWMVAATQSGIFSALFALAVVTFAEWRRIREWTYYAMAGIVIALLGFAAQWLSESTGQNWSVVGSNYPLVAFLTTGFVGGFAYWALAGRSAGGAGPHTAPPAGDASANKA